jgi:hypothetical protein
MAKEVILKKRSFIKRLFRLPAYIVKVNKLMKDVPFKDKAQFIFNNCLIILR